MTQVSLVRAQPAAAPVRSPSTGRPTAGRPAADGAAVGAATGSRDEPAEAAGPPAPVGRTPGSPLRMRNWRVRSKLAAVLIVPAVAFSVVAGLDIAHSAQDALALDRFASQVALGRPVTALVQELQRERDRTTGYMIATGSGRGDGTTDQLSAALAVDARSVDAAIRQYRLAVARLRAEPGRQAQARLAAADRALSQLEPLRQSVRVGALRQGAVFDGYATIITALLDVLPDASGVSDARLAQQVAAVKDLSLAKELDAQLRGRLYAIAYAGSFTVGEFQAFADLRAERSAAIDRFRDEADPTQLGEYEDAVKGQAALAAARIEQTAVDRYQGPNLGIDPEQWWAASTTQLELVHTVERTLLDQAVTAADERGRSEWRSVALAGVLIGLILVAAFLISLAIGRSMARSLRRLRNEARTIAYERLPQVITRLRTTPRGDPVVDVPPTTVESSDDIGEVAVAFDEVHREAVRLALEQAVLRRNVNAMFVNLARRSQVLVERQLRLIDNLEQREQSTEQLEGLFTLDHLASRMRRNDESLLVLAGSESSRRWSEPVSLGQVMLAAVAEIEHYSRIRHESQDRMFIVGHAVADLVHVLAELLENATAFSPPTTVVHLTGRLIRGGTEAIITIEDAGMGMSPGAFKQANGQLAEPPIVDVAVSERMGLYVVSHLAARHGIEVDLRPSVAGGVIAVVVLPSGLLATLSGGSPADVHLTGTTSDRRVRGGPLARRPGARPANAFITSSPLTPGTARLTSPWWVGQNPEWVGPPARGQSRTVTAGVSPAGLPIRVPLANCPPAVADQPVTARSPGAHRASSGTLPEPEEVGSTLSRFYSGVRRADAEYDVSTDPAPNQPPVS